VDELKTPFLKAPVAKGSATARAHVNSQFDYVRTAHRFEGGNPNFLGIRVLRSGAEFIQTVGLRHIENRVRQLTTTCLELLAKAGLKTQTPQDWDERAHIVNVIVPDAAGLMERLREKHRIVTNVKDDALRLSMSFFNCESDLERAVHTIRNELPAKSTVAA
jgi:selenocysteine lyase/cysteine desulfurase